MALQKTKASDLAKEYLSSEIDRLPISLVNILERSAKIWKDAQMTEEEKRLAMKAELLQKKVEIETKIAEIDSSISSLNDVAGNE